MKKKLIAMSASVLMMVMLSLPAWAATDLTNPEAVLPVDIIVDQEAREIRKVYDLSPNMDPSVLPMDSFLRDGVQYECADVLREVVIGTETKSVTQEESAESGKKDMETILGLFPQEKEITTEEGYTGTVRLDLDSIKTEPAGYGSSTKAVTTTRSYPNLASADMNHLPKTVTEGGRTYTLQDVQWQTDNTYNADDYEIGDRFTAICTYGGTKTSSCVTGYLTKANYVGEVHRTGVSVIRYTVIYTGIPVEPEVSEPPEPVDEPASIHWAAVAVPAAIVALAAGGGGTYLFMKRKERTFHEETADRSGC